MDPLHAFSSTMQGKDYEHQFIGDKQVAITEHFLNQGYAVVAPYGNKQLKGWQTNVRPYNNLGNWEESEDHQLLLEIEKMFQNEKFGFKIDLTRMHAFGFSDGGFMTSRMAFSYPNNFKSLSILSGGYYQCFQIIDFFDSYNNSYNNIEN